VDLIVRSAGTLTCSGKVYRCALGRGGVGDKQKEGDGITPLGRFPLRQVFYRADRLKKPKTGLSTRIIEKKDGWCDAPDHPNYNQLIEKPFTASHESLWRDDGLYDLVVVIGYNDDPIIPGKGSAIFIHIAKPDYAPTEGCVALSREDLLEVLSKCGSDGTISIG